VQLVSAPVGQAPALVARLLRKAEHELADTELGAKVVELVEELLVRRFPQLNREEMRAMFDLEDLRKTRVWQEARAEGREQGRLLAKKNLVYKWLAKGKGIKEIADLLEIPVPEARRLAKDVAK
jgi:predicted transposase YdaD